MKKSVMLSENLFLDIKGRLIACTIWEGDSTLFVLTGLKNKFGEPVFICNEICITKERTRK